MPAPAWDEDACDEAERQAQEIEAYDADAAADMRAMAASARHRLIDGNASTGYPSSIYDPMKIYARMAKYYGWSHRDMENMHFVTFFAYAREASEMNEEERREMERARRGQGASTEHVGGMFQEAQSYQGETVGI